MKKCSQCKIERSLSDFNNSSREKDGKRYECRKCQSLNSKERYEKIKNNKDFIEKQKKQKKKYYSTQRGKETKRENDKNYRKRNKESIREKRKKKYEDPYFILEERVRGRFRKIVRRNIIECKESKTKKSRELLGCEIKEYKEYLENLFTEGMSWGNYGDWHIDHIKPICLFNLNDEIELSKAFNYKNTQPLWAKDNLSKGAKFEN